jgi:hypothetical protein
MTSSRRTGTSAVADAETTDGTGATTSFEEQHPLAEAGQEATQATSRLVDRATNVGFERADEGRHRIADGLDQAVSRIRQMSTEMEGQQPMIASVAGTAADGAERVAEYLHTTDARQMISGVENLARRQPILFLGGAFVAGVALARLLKAGTGTGSSSAGYGPYTPGAASAYQPTGPGGTAGDR